MSMDGLEMSIAKMSLNPKGIPEDVALQLFSKLSIKDLMRFKSVSKHWDHMICDPFLSKMYIQHSAMTNMLLFLNLRRAVAKLAWLNPEVAYRAETTGKPIPLPSRIGPEVKVLGYVDGLLCISGESTEILLFNPCTRECRDLKLHLLSGRRLSYYSAGIGYDKATQDYKVVVIVFESNTSIENNRVMVFSLRENLWREVNGDFPYSLGCNDTHRVPVDGAIHWFVKGKNRSRVIVSFDLATEEMKEIPLPDRGDYAEAICERNCRINLGAVDGRLALLLHSQCDREGEGRFYIQVWLMDELGSWSRKELHCYDAYSNRVEPHSVSWVERPVSCWKNEPVFLSKDGQVWVRDAPAYCRNLPTNCIATPIGFHNTLVALAPSPVSPYGNVMHRSHLF